MSTFPEALREALRHDPGRPFVTFYDEASGERQELSLTTYANWVAKASSLLADEHGLERGQTIRVDLPTHWLAAVFLGAAWNIGLIVTTADDPDAVVCGPATLERWQHHDLALACSLLPFGVRFADPLPVGMHDVGIEIWSQPDAFTPYDPPAPDDVAADWTTPPLTQDALLVAGADAGARLLLLDPPATPTGSAAVAGALVTHGSLVLVASADSAGPGRLDEIRTTERVTRP